MTALKRFPSQTSNVGRPVVVGWGDRFWLVVIVAALVGLSVWFGEINARAHLGPIVLTSIATGVGAVALLLAGERCGDQIRGINPGTTVSVLLP